MKRIIIVTGLVLAVSIWFYFSGVGEQEQITRQIISPTVITPKKPVPSDISQTMVFIPYWNIPSEEDFSGYDTLIYFGVTPDNEGALKKDTGFSGLETFVTHTSPTKKRYLTVRMLDTATNIDILENQSAQASLIEKLSELSVQHHLEGVVLDLEMSVIPFSDTQKDISHFVTRMADQLHKRNLELMVTIYGDTFYRSRPYDVSLLGDKADRILIMAYDFHKSRGEPGPNFPFDRKGEYDFKQMVQDFSQHVDAEKLTVVFGMYGYDWTLGEQGLPLKTANAIPLHEIESDIIPGCTGDCIISTDKASQETKVTYSDPEGYDHVMWFENEASVEVKKEYLEEQGIGSIGYWVWGYF